MKCYRVGGAVRDHLLGKRPKDSDWVVVGATPEQMIELGYQPVGRDFPVFLHPESKEAYALARTERKTAPGYRGFRFHTAPGVTLEEDLKRRDLTINAMAEDANGEIIDPYGGRRDLEHRQLRHVSPAFVEDPLRVLRAARFAARLGFTVAPETLALMRELTASGELETLAPERVFQELELALGESYPRRFFEVLEDCGALSRLFPGIHFHQPRLNGLDGPTALAALLAPAGAAAENLCQRYRVPTTWRHAAVHAAHLWTACNGPPPSARDLLSLLKKADAFRRPENFAQICTALAAARMPSPSLQRLELAHQAAGTVTTAETEGLEGASRGRAIDQLRAERIAEALCQETKS